MSAGAFGFYAYKADNDTVHIIEMQPETKAMNDDLGATPGSTDDAVRPRAIVSGSKRRKGVLHARTVSIKNGTPPSGYKANSPISLPITTLTVYNSLPEPGASLGVNYLGTSGWVVVSKSPEVWRN